MQEAAKVKNVRQATLSACRSRRQQPLSKYELDDPEMLDVIIYVSLFQLLASQRLKSSSFVKVTLVRRTAMKLNGPS